MKLTTELAALYRQQLCQYDELKDLREKVRAAEQRYTAIGDEIGRELAKQILPSAAALSGADSAPAPQVREVAGGFKLTAFTPRGVSMLDAMDRVLARLPHGDSL